MISCAIVLGLLLLFVAVSASPLCAADAGVRPVTPDASPEAVKLLQFIHSISGQRTLAGQHCAPLVESTRLVVVQRATGRYPALFGQDFGFDAPGAWDGINFRQRIVDEAIRRHHEGFIITLMWHAVRPTEDEPVTFHESVSGKVTDAEWQELVTPGSRLHERWKSQVDVIAWHLRQLQYASVPVLWRPYHEMNGGWFWWGKKRGENGYRKLYRMLYDRLTNFHNLRNLIWVYNCNEVGDNVDPYEACYPGADVVDILATDVYRNGFAQRDYDQLLALAGDKPIALGEVGGTPSLDILKKQPRWAWFMCWGDPPWRDMPAYRALFESEQVLTHERLPWVHLAQPKVHYPVLR
jgi:mannan endo-1,4-beta-mannosidase